MCGAVGVELVSLSSCFIRAAVLIIHAVHRGGQVCCHLCTRIEIMQSEGLLPSLELFVSVRYVATGAHCGHAARSWVITDCGVAETNTQDK